MKCQLYKIVRGSTEVPHLPRDFWEKAGLYHYSKSQEPSMVVSEDLFGGVIKANAYLIPSSLT